MDEHRWDPVGYCADVAAESSSPSLHLPQYQMKRLMTAKFDFTDFLAQYKAVTSMGGMSQVMKMLPGMSAISEKQPAMAEKQFKVYESMVRRDGVAMMIPSISVRA